MKKKIAIALATTLVSAIAFAAISGTTNLAGLIYVQDYPSSPPTCATSTAAGELCVEGDLETNGNLDVAGTTTQTGLLTLGGGLKRLAVAVGATDPVLTSADCGKQYNIAATFDTHIITLPAASTVAGIVCELTFVYTGADGGALIDITPLDAGNADGIEGGCTLAASVVTFSGAADADIGLTKATVQTGDYIRLVNCGAAQWCAAGIQGICANN